MKRILLISFLLMAAMVIGANAQSLDQDSPTPFTANEVKGTGTDEKTEYFYSFNADPGEVTVTFDVKADKNASISGFDYEILNAKGKRLAGGFVDPVRGESKRAVATVSVKGPGTQQLLLKLIVTEFVATYRVRLGGSVAASADSAAALSAGGGASPAALPQSTPDPTAAQPAVDATAVQPEATATQPAADAATADAGAAQPTADAAKPAKKINFDFNLKDKLNLLKDIPTSGSMVILMKDGTTQEIQMKNVKSITMKP